jgi:hypothetical protein
VESRSHFKNGLVNHALSAALRAFLLVNLYLQKENLNSVSTLYRELIYLNLQVALLVVERTEQLFIGPSIYFKIFAFHLCWSSLKHF